MLITATKDMRWVGYGFRLVAGPNEVSRVIPPGLMASLRRHKKAGNVEFSEPGEAKADPVTVQGHGSKKDKKHRGNHGSHPGRVSS